MRLTAASTDAEVFAVDAIAQLWTSNLRVAAFALNRLNVLTSCAGAATICPTPLLPSVNAEAPRAAEPTAT